MSEDANDQTAGAPKPSKSETAHDADGAPWGLGDEQRVEVRSAQNHSGDLGVGGHHEPSDHPGGHLRRVSGKTERRHCLRGDRSLVVRRPRAF